MQHLKKDKGKTNNTDSTRMISQQVVKDTEIKANLIS